MPFGLGRSLGAGAAGARQALDFQNQQEDRRLQQQTYAADQARQAQLDSMDRTLFDQQSQQFAQQQADRSEFGLPDARDAREQRKTQRDREKAILKLGRAYATKDIGSLNELVDQFIPGASLNQAGEDNYVIRTSDGREVPAGGWEAAVWGDQKTGKPGFYQVVNPDDGIAERKDKNKRAVSREDTDYRHKLRLGEIAARRRPMAQYGIGPNGEQLLFDGTRASLVLGPDGTPITSGGVGRGRQERPFGNTTEGVRIENEVKMAMATIPEFKDMDIYEVAAAVRDFGNERNAHAARERLAASLIRGIVSSPEGQFMSPEEIKEKAGTMLNIIGGLVGQEPRLSAAPGGPRNSGFAADGGDLGGGGTFDAEEGAVVLDKRTGKKLKIIGGQLVDISDNGLGTTDAPPSSIRMIPDPRGR